MQTYFAGRRRDGMRADRSVGSRSMGRPRPRDGRVGRSSGNFFYESAERWRTGRRSSQLGRHAARFATFHGPRPASCYHSLLSARLAAG